MDRDVLLEHLRNLKKEFEGFPEEHVFRYLIDYFQHTSYNMGTFSGSELLRMARILGGVCREHTCSKCPFNGTQCPTRDWYYIKNSEIDRGQVGRE